MSTPDTSYSLTRGTTPLLISFPHSGTDAPADLTARWTKAALALPDTDWHVPKLYAFAKELGAWTLEAHFSRYVVDLNRPPDDSSLYPGQAGTGVVPIQTFSREPIYREGAEPIPGEIDERIRRYWHPYHAALRRALDQIRETYGTAVLYDAHSIRSQVPMLFAGRLAELNLGTAHGQSCAPGWSELLQSQLAAGPELLIVDGRFVGGYITRHYGQPDAHVHAIQMEIAQDAYMVEAPPYAWDAERARALASRLARALQSLVSALPKSVE